LQDQLDSLAHQLGGYARHLGDARIAWQDAAAREVFDRYLDPHQTSLDELCRHLGRQLAELRQCVELMEGAGKPEQEVQRLSNESARLRGLASNDLEIAHRCVDAGLHAAAEANYLAARADNILARIPKVFRGKRG
jgi:hypothetical protein